MFFLWWRQEGYHVGQVRVRSPFQEQGRNIQLTIMMGCMAVQGGPIILHHTPNQNEHQLAGTQFYVCMYVCMEKDYPVSLVRVRSPVQQEIHNFKVAMIDCICQGSPANRGILNYNIRDMNCPILMFILYKQNCTINCANLTHTQKYRTVLT